MQILGFVHRSQMCPRALGDLPSKHMMPTNNRQHQNGDNQIPTGQEAALSTGKPLEFASDQRIQEASSGRRTSTVARNKAQPQPQESFEEPTILPAEASGPRRAQAMSLVMQEMDDLRARMEQIMRRQHEEAAGNSALAQPAPSEDDDHRTAPPAYSELGDR